MPSGILPRSPARASRILKPRLCFNQPKKNVLEALTAFQSWSQCAMIVVGKGSADHLNRAARFICLAPLIPDEDCRWLSCVR